MHALPLRNLTRYFLFRRNESPPPPRISRKWNVFVFFLKFWHDSNFWISVVTLLTDKKINNNRFLLSNSKSSFPPATLERSFRETSTYQHPGLLITDTHTLSLSLSLSVPDDHVQPLNRLFICSFDFDRASLSPFSPTVAGCSPWQRTQEPRRQQRNNSFP